DGSGCSLLHWAAINNRSEIARLLMEAGIAQTAGGVLGESPLQWAVRRRYYSMMEQIVQRGQCDLSHRSTQGNDALMLACKLGDISAAFLLL
ncbi:ankyrin repeat-containing domain protein, partial [Ochromonadaceae sp. CCMP2298]